MRALALTIGLVAAMVSLVALAAPPGGDPRARCAACSVLPSGTSGTDLSVSALDAGVALINGQLQVLGNTVISIQNKYCLNVACTAYVTTDGSSNMLFGLSNATYYTITNSSGVMTTPYAFTSSIASGSNAFGVLTNGARTDFGAGASDYASSDGTTVTFAGPLAASSYNTITMGSNQTVSLSNGGATISGPAGVFYKSTAPTVTACSGTAASITAHNGTGSVVFDVGTSCAGESTAVLTLPAATVGWLCSCASTTADRIIQQKVMPASTTQATLQNIVISTGANGDFTDGADVGCICHGL
jgi:hypothetical protein